MALAINMSVSEEIHHGYYLHPTLYSTGYPYAHGYYAHAYAAAYPYGYYGAVSSPLAYKSEDLKHVNDLPSYVRLARSPKPQYDEDDDDEDWRRK